MAEIMPIWRKTLSNQSINPCYYSYFAYWCSFKFIKKRGIYLYRENKPAIQVLKNDRGTQ